MSSNWLEQYAAALAERDAHEQANKPYIDAYTRLADRTAALSSTKTDSAAPQASVPTTAPTTKDRASPPTKGKAANYPSTQPPEVVDHLTSLRTDLATTQKARSVLQTRLDDLTTTLTSLQTQNKTSDSQIASLTRSKAETERKLRDREEELRGKDRLVEQAQDEMVALGLQLNMAEQRSERMGRENEELVARWMKRMGEEAERVNRDAGWE